MNGQDLQALQQGQTAQQAKAEAMSFVDKFNEVILNPVIVLLMAVALIVFLYGAFEFLKNADNEQGRDTGRKHMLWGLIGLVIMMSAWSIIHIAAATFGVDDELDQFRPSQVRGQ